MNEIMEKQEVATVEPSGTPVPVEQDEPATLMAIIARAASDPAIDIDKMRALLDMKKEVERDQSERLFNEALRDAQIKTHPISADASNSQTRSKYATYAALDKVLRPIYTGHGFSVSFDTGDGAPDGHIRVLLYLSHIGGHTRTYRVDLPADGKGAKGGDVMTKTHAAGAAMSYGMRYLLKLAFNVSVGEHDVDGNEEVEKISDEQLDELLAIADEVGCDKEKFCKMHKVEAFAEISAANFEPAKKALCAYGEKK